jgi:hypothetical protein
VEENCHLPCIADTTACPQEFKGRTLAADWSLAKAAYTSQAAVDGPAPHEGETYGSSISAAAYTAQDTPTLAAAAKNMQEQANGRAEAASGEAMIVGARTEGGDTSKDKSSGKVLEEDAQQNTGGSSDEEGVEDEAGWGSTSEDEDEDEGSVPHDNDDDKEEEAEDNGEEPDEGMEDGAQVEMAASEVVSRAEREMLARVLHAVMGVRKPGRDGLMGEGVRGEDVTVETRGQHAAEQKEESKEEKKTEARVKESAGIEKWEAGRSEVPAHERRASTGAIKTQVFIRNIPLDATTIDLQARLQRFGTIKACRCGASA